jgi:hypothetical protein
MSDVVTEAKELLDGYTKTSESNPVPEVKSDSSNISDLKTDPDVLEAFRQNVPLYLIRNVDSKVTLLYDWTLNLLPDDAKSGWEKYLAEQYNLYGLDRSSMTTVITVVLVQGRSINFLENYLISIGYPKMVSRREGRIEKMASRFILPPGESVIMSESQSEALIAYKKSRMRFDKGNDDEEKVSDWTGFLVFKPLSRADYKPEYKHILTTRGAQALNTFTLNAAQRGNETQETGAVEDAVE